MAFTGSCTGLSVLKTTPRKIQPQQGRNEKCNCGSGKKFKNCCTVP
ncbi:SEC-C metal-binding domain-containing protein [Acinetobacter sp.]